MMIQEFKSKLKNRVALVDFGAAWCSPCRQFEPVIQGLKEKYRGRVSVVFVNIDSSAPLATHYRVQSVPTVILFENGHEIRRFIGLQPPERLERSLEAVLADYA